MILDCKRITDQLFHSQNDYPELKKETSSTFGTSKESENMLFSSKYFNSKGKKYKLVNFFDGWREDHTDPCRKRLSEIFMFSGKC